MTADAIEQLGNWFDEAFFVIGIAILLIEIAKGLFQGKLKWHGVFDMVSSASTQIPSILAETFLLYFVYVGFVVVSDYFIPWTMPINVWTILLALLACDFVYYWEHRLAHDIRLLWTQHAVHHSSRHMNVSVAIRFGPLEGAISALLHFPLVLIGFPAELVFFGILFVLAYQVWIHTELIGKLPVLDEFLNTPANHRVHHGCDEKYIDTNYGGILIIWDRLFGTYQREEETPRYGLKRDFDSVNPLVVWFSELPQLYRDIKSARNSSEVWGYLFRPPGWRPQADKQLGHLAKTGRSS
ncbi:MAG: sterol desaturase family protein [Pseudomonadota bacterium]